MNQHKFLYLAILLVSSHLNSCQSNEEAKDGNYRQEEYSKETGDNSKMNPLIKEAKDLLKQNKYKEAIKKFEEAELIYGSIDAYLSDKALCYTELGNYTKSLELNSKYIYKYKNDPIGWSNRGMVYMRLEKFRLALEDFNMSIELDPKEAGLYYNRYFAYASLGRNTNACKDLKRALDLGFTEKYGNDALDRYNRDCIGE